MARLIPGKTKVQMELFQGVRLADILVATVAFLAVVFVVISSLPYKFYIILGLLLLAGALLMRMDTVPNYVYLLHMLRHFAYRRRYGRAVSDESLLDPEGSKQKSFSKVFGEKEGAKAETDKERQKRRKEEDKLLASPEVSEEEKEQLRARRKEEYRISAQRLALQKEQSVKREPMENLIAFTDIRDGYIGYAGAYYGAVIQVPPVEFRFFSTHRRNNTIENGLGKLLRSIHSGHGMNIIKLERPIRYDEYLVREHRKLDQLRASYEKGMITEGELQSRVEIMYDRIAEVEKLCGEDKVVEPFYYIALFDSDKRQLDNQVENALSTLRNAEMDPKRLNDRELAIFLKYTNCLDFDENQVDRLKPTEYAQWAMPQYVNVKFRTVEVNRIVTHNMRVVDYPTTVSDAWLAGVFSMPATKCVVKCRPMDRDKSVRAIDRSLQELRGQFASTGVDSRKIELQTHIDTLSSLLATLQQDNESLMEVNIYITAYDYIATQSNPNIVTPEKSMLPRVPNMKRTVRRAWQEAGIRLNNMELTQMEAFIGSQVSGWDPLHKEGRGIPSNSLAAGYPWIYASVSDLGGIRMGKSEGVPVFIDFFRRDSERVNSNMVIVGKSGSGKSYATKSLLANLAAEDSKIFILDPENEYTELAQNLHGKFINVGNAQHGRLNPFQIITALDDDESTGGSSGSYATHLQFLEEFFRQILPDCDKDAMEYLNSLVDRVYTNRGITPETDLSTLRPEDYPVFDDLYDTILAEFQQTDNNYIRSILRVLMNYIAKFSTGGRNATIWNGPSSVTTEENFIVFNFQSLLANRNNTIANAQMLLVLKHIDNEIIKNKDYNARYGLQRKVVVVIDEAHVFIDTKFPVALDFMFQLAKRIRKYNGMQIVITQNIKDFVGNEEIARKSTAIINACQYSFIFALAPNDIEDLCKLYEKAGGINENEQEQITSAPRGQAFAVMSAASRTTFRVEAPESVVHMFEKPGYISQYFTGPEGRENWDAYMGDSRMARMETLLQDLEEEPEHTEAPAKKTVTFLELDEEALEELEAQEALAARKEQQELVREETVTVKRIREISDEPVPVKLSETPLVQILPMPEPRKDPEEETTAQTLAKLLSDFSFDAMRNEIRRSVEELGRELSQNVPQPAQNPAQAQPQPVLPPQTHTQPVTPEPVVTPQEPVRASGPMALGAIQPATVAVPASAPAAAQDAKAKPDYSDFILPESGQKQEKKPSGGLDIMALLCQQAKKLEDTSPIDMMASYGDQYVEVTLEELEKYINRNSKGAGKK